MRCASRLLADEIQGPSKEQYAFVLQLKEGGVKTMSKNPHLDICAGGTADQGSTTITFLNHHDVECTITGLGSLVDCGDSFGVSPKSGSTPGSKTCTILSTASPGSYEYSASCCRKKETNPAIIYQ